MYPTIFKVRNIQIFFFFFFIVYTNISYSQSIEFNLTECLVYKNDEIDLKDTRLAREGCENEKVILTFYPNTEIVELEVTASGFINDILKLKKDDNGNYTTMIVENNIELNFELILNKIFGYIRGGNIKVTVTNPEEGQGEVIIKFVRA